MSRPRMMPDGSIHFPKTGVEPPCDIEGYKRRKDKWVFDPVFTACPYRLSTFYKKKCGSTTLQSYCRTGGGPVKSGELVTLAICSSCPIGKTVPPSDS